MIHCHSDAAGEKPEPNRSPRGNDWRAAYVAYWPSKGPSPIAYLMPIGQYSLAPEAYYCR